MGWILGTQNLFCCQLVDGCIFGSSTECFLFFLSICAWGHTLCTRVEYMGCDAV